jgi:hypothetical protein
MRARIISCLALLFALASPAFAAGRQPAGRPSFDRILPEIRRHTPGTFYDAQGPYIGEDGQARYRIKWMTPGGRIVWFEVDARRGRILGMVTGTLPSSSGRRGREPDEYGPPYSRGDDGDFAPDGDPGGRSRDGREDPDRFGDWPGYDRGYDRQEGDRGSREGDRGNGDEDRAGRGRDGGDRDRGDSGRGRRDRH